MELERFLDAQRSVYDTALNEIRNGGKRSHWIWYIFPQLRGMGHSYNSEYYGICDMAEAISYLEHPILGMRLREISNELMKHVGESASVLMGSRIDSIKLRSCMTLFDYISPDEVFNQVLIHFYDGKRDKKTLRMIDELKQHTI